MQHVRSFDAFQDFRGGFVSIGNFDGVHRGHQSMIATLVREARAHGVPAVVFTFDPHPITILRPEFVPPPLTTTARKLELLAAGGVDCVLVYPTDRALLDLSPDAFFEQIVISRMQARGLVEGPNFFYGHDRAGNVATLQHSCTAAGLELEIVHPVRIGERLVSSTEVRKSIQSGDVVAAAELLGHPYCVEGTVVHGAERGRTIGFPTANLAEVQTVLPADGVYAGRACFGARNWPAAINLGPNPTFGEGARKLEVHLLNFAGDLYGQVLRVEFIEHLRGTRRFDGPAELIAQLQEDVTRVRNARL